MNDGQTQDENLERFNLLKNSEILHGLSEHQLLELLNNKKILTYNQNDIIFEQNSLNTDMFIILKGKVNLMLDPETVGNVEKGTVGLYPIASFERGQVFGELALFDGKPRSATAFAAQDNTELLVIPANFFADYFRSDSQGETRSLIPCVVQNIAKDLSKKLRNTNTAIINEMLSVYFIKVLVEDILVTHYDCDLISPLKRQIIVHLSDYFILASFNHEFTKKEIIDTYFFAEVPILKAVMDGVTPNGEVIINTILTVIRTGKMPTRINSDAFTLKFANPADTREGTLSITKHDRNYSIKWQLKGIIYDKNTQFTYANLFLYVSEENKKTMEEHIEQLIQHYDMPIQQHICKQLQNKVENAQRFRMIVIHHRTHEVVTTLNQLSRLGFTLDTVIGIPYGDASWESNIVLNQASNQRYYSLKTITDVAHPTKYVFDFKSSSFLDIETEKDLIDLYSDPAVHSDYMHAMYALIEYCFVKTIERCILNREKLIIYEDGGYSERLYQIYHDIHHPLYELIHRLIDEGVIVGIVEGTMSGERRHLQYMAAHNNQCLLPVLSSARSLVKTFFESKGIAESVIHSSSTALGRIGLPTFQQRRLAIIGGNGVIGRRLVEQMVSIHNGTADLIVVDINDEMQQSKLDPKFAHVADRLKFHNIERYPLDERAQYIWFPTVPWENDEQLHASAYFSQIESFFNFKHADNKLIILNCSDVTRGILQRLLPGYFKNQNITQQKVTEKNNIVEYILLHNMEPCSVTLLPENTVLSAKKLSPFILDRIDTIIGVTGYSVMSAMDLAAFLLSPQTKQGLPDQLILTSGSSKDYEFKHCIDFLDCLLYLTKDAEPDASLIAKLDKYKDVMHHVLFSKYADMASLQKALQEKINIVKYIHTDVGSSYHIVLYGQHKIIHMLADGFVINFFAKHEKGAKSEYIDPIVTLQLLSVVRLAQGQVLAPGLYDAANEVGDEYIHYMWEAIDELCKPFLGSL